MADVHSKAVRSFNMSRIRSKNTKPEILIRKFLHAEGFRFRIHVRDLPGKPDIVLKKYRTAIFVQGCFWHGHQGCRYFVMPKTKTEWWASKIDRNRHNDQLSIEKLRAMGWKVLEVWECGLKKTAAGQTLETLAAQIDPDRIPKNINSPAVHR